MKLTLGFSPCPNDTYIFDALVHQKVDTEGLEFDYFMADVEELNRRAFNEVPDITKVSFHAFLHLAGNYLLLDSGAALGFGVGPLVISMELHDFEELNGKKVAIPGRYTTANLLFSLAMKEPVIKKEMLFSDIENAVLTGETDAGVIIHEGRFTYASKGLHKLIDLDDISRQAYANTDIPGCISDFISEKFGGLLQIDMEKILNDKLTGHTTLDNDVHRRLLDMMDKSVPMFNTRPAYAHTSASKFSIVSVPQNTLRILSAAQKYLGSPNNIVKTSKETTRLYVVKCVAGIPLYAFGRMEEMEAAYERLMSTPETRKGTHLWQDWFERFPSPLGEGAWTAEIYKNARVDLGDGWFYYQTYVE